MRISDWSSDVCSSDLVDPERRTAAALVLPDLCAGLGRTGPDAVETHLRDASGQGCATSLPVDGDGLVGVQDRVLDPVGGALGEPRLPGVVQVDITSPAGPGQQHSRGASDRCRDRDDKSDTPPATRHDEEIGRASGREREGEYVYKSS